MNDLEDLSPVPTSLHPTTYHDFKLEEKQILRYSLLEWYLKNRRKLPWRGDEPPYIVTSTHMKNQSLKSQTKRKGQQVKGQISLTKFFRKKVSNPVNESKPSSPVCIAYETPPPRRITPYETWVSEIMCQQTRVDTVVSYFLKWMEAFPTIEILSKAKIDEVNTIWAGLGYYRRARMLHEGAQFVMKEFNGEMPQAVEKLLTIPGIGPYTAGAIASIAFNIQTPLVDGNVIRVLSRLRAIGLDSKSKELQRICWKLGNEIVDPNQPGNFNQSLMELGATICTPQNPKCDECPVQSICLAFKEVSQTKLHNKTSTNNSQDLDLSKSKPLCTICDTNEVMSPTTTVMKYPLKAKRIVQRSEVIGTTVIAWKSSMKELLFLLLKRPSTGLLASQWEFPSFKIGDGSEIPSYSKRKQLYQESLEELLQYKTLRKNIITLNDKNWKYTRKDGGQLTHVFSHVKHHIGIEYVEFLTDEKFAKPPSIYHLQKYEWMSSKELKAVGLTTGMKKIFQRIETISKIRPDKWRCMTLFNQMISDEQVIPITSEESEEETEMTSCNKRHKNV